jgi:hypothetical protein
VELLLHPIGMSKRDFEVIMNEADSVQACSREAGPSAVGNQACGTKH